MPIRFDHHIDPLHVRGAHGPKRARPYPVSPNRWRGEANCVVGPFSSREIAERFAGHSSDFGCYSAYHFRVFAKHHAWYAEVLPLEG